MKIYRTPLDWLWTALGWAFAISSCLQAFVDRWEGAWWAGVLCVAFWQLGAFSITLASPTKTIQEA